MFDFDLLAGPPFPGIGTFLSGTNGGGAHDGGTAGRTLDTFVTECLCGISDAMIQRQTPASCFCCFLPNYLGYTQLLSQGGTSSSAASASAVAAATTPSKPDKPIFTLKQMSMIGKAFNCAALIIGPQNLN